METMTRQPVFLDEVDPTDRAEALRVLGANTEDGRTVIQYRDNPYSFLWSNAAAYAEKNGWVVRIDKNRTKGWTITPEGVAAVSR